MTFGTAMVCMGALYFIIAGILAAKGIRGTHLLVISGILLVTTAMWFEDGDDEAVMVGLCLSMFIYMGHQMYKSRPESPTAR